MLIIVLYIVYSQPAVHTTISDGFWIIDYSGNIIYYTEVIFIMGLILFSSFGETEKYMSGYGINVFVRTSKRNTITSAITKKCLLTAVLWSCVILAAHTASAAIFSHISFEPPDIKYIILAVMVIYSLLLWQSAAELWFDAGTSLLIVISGLLLMIYLDTARKFYDMGEHWLLLLYVNMGFKGKMELSGVSFVPAFITIALFIAAQTLILYVGVKKKDIL